jgi:hypothetical protein
LGFIALAVLFVSAVGFGALMLWHAKGGH